MQFTFSKNLLAKVINLTANSVFFVFLTLSLTQFSPISASKDTWWNQIVPSIEAHTTATWTHSQPTFQLTLGTSLNKRKLKLDDSTSNNQKFWESKSFEELLRDNQKDGVDDNAKPFRQSFKTWEYVKEDNEPGRLIERSWENNEKNTPIERRVETVVDDNDGKAKKVVKKEYGAKLNLNSNSNTIRWDDKAEFNEGSVLTHVQNRIREEQKLSKEKQRKTQQQNQNVIANQITLRKTLETEDIPITPITKTSAKTNAVSPRLVKKSGIRKVQATVIESPMKKIEGRGRVWFKTENLSNDSPVVSISTDIVHDNPKPARRRVKKKKVKFESQALTLTTTSTTTQEPPRQPKQTYTFTWGKRRDEDNERMTTEAALFEEVKPVTVAKETEPSVEPENPSNDDEERFTAEELDALRKFNSYQTEWEDNARRKNEEAVLSTTEPPPSTTITSRPISNSRQRSRPTNRRNQGNTELVSAKEKKDRNVINYRTSIDHPKKEEKEALVVTLKPEVVIDDEVIYAERKPKRKQSKQLKKRIDNTVSVNTVKPEIRKADLIEAVKEILYERDESITDDGKEKAKQRAKEPEDGTERPARLEDVIPGVPEQDYGTYTTVPKTNFKCSDQKYPGYYGDTETKCQVFHICEEGGKQSSFVCPIGTVFNQKLFVCDWWNHFKCDETSSYFDLNQDIYKTEKKETANRARSTRDSQPPSSSSAVDSVTPGVVHAEDADDSEGNESSKRQVYSNVRKNKSKIYDNIYFPNGYDERTIWTQIG